MAHIIGVIKNSLAGQVMKRVQAQYPQANIVAERGDKFTTIQWREGAYTSQVVTDGVAKFIRQATAGIMV